MVLRMGLSLAQANSHRRKAQQASYSLLFRSHCKLFISAVEGNLCLPLVCAVLNLPCPLTGFREWSEMCDQHPISSPSLFRLYTSQLQSL